MALRGPTPRATEAPSAFADACAGLRALKVRPEVVVQETAAPQRLAPYAVALGADVTVAGAEAATGRLVVLHDPDGQDAWQGTTRLVAYVKAECEAEMAADPLLPAVGWSWLSESLQARGAAATAMAGTVTRVCSESFGELADAGRGGTAEVELRASWSPLGLELVPHAQAWLDLLCTAAGLPPVPSGVAPLPARR